MNQQPMKRYTGQNLEQGVLSFLTLGGTWKLSKKGQQDIPFGFLRRLYYVVTIVQIIGCWQLIQPQAPLPSPEIRTESSNSLTIWQPGPTLGEIQKSPH